MIKTNHHKCGKDVQKIENKTERQTSKIRCPINNVWHVECFICVCVCCWCCYCECVSSFFCSQSEKMHLAARWKAKSKKKWYNAEGKLSQSPNHIQAVRCIHSIFSAGCMDKCVWKCFEWLLTTPSKNTIKCYLLSQCSLCPCPLAIVWVLLLIT